MKDLRAELLEARLCDLLPSISKGPVKVRHCLTCGKGYKPPYECPLDKYRKALADQGGANTEAGR